MLVRILRLPDIPGHGKALKTISLLTFSKKMELALEFWSLPFQFLSNASANLPVFGTWKDVSSRRIEQV